MDEGTLNYKNAGVDIEAGERIVSSIKDLPVLLSPRSFDANRRVRRAFKPDMSRYSEPVFAAATDGVGTKLKLAFILQHTL